MFNEFFERAISAVNATHSFNSRLSESLAPLRGTSSPNNFDQIVVPVKKIDFTGSVAGVDSGFVSKKLSFIDLVLVKTAGVLFKCENGSLISSTYYPAPFSFPEPMILRAGLEKDEEQQSISLLRLEKEVSCAIEMIKKFKPEFMFIDGSIVPQYQDKPRKESGVNEDYVSIIHSFQKLYKTAEENSCTLVACVEDSRGTRFRQLLAEEILPKSKLKISSSSLNGAFDASILDYYLRPSERTFVFPYTNQPESHAILKDYSKEWSESIFVFYLKASEYDKPLRVEFVCKNQKDLAELSEKISSLVFSLSSLHKEYSFPSILIEADLRAGLSEQEISVVYERLVDRLGTKIRMRRGNRPFG
ncbi:NurA domain protein [uncultured archaeon]|nr:NurA domain protein [uncultured archaeon]